MGGQCSPKVFPPDGRMSTDLGGLLDGAGAKKPTSYAGLHTVLDSLG
jgi:hypothetical protein